MSDKFPLEKNDKNYLVIVIVIISIISTINIVMMLDLWLFKSAGDRCTYKMCHSYEVRLDEIESELKN